ncbi:unnamed protein product [Chilo suppressalis]|uniref:FLYWCH-type domain-containing protein n=1 Tax=Chilo suppressalis TaxID=168631 RepID=A0ABN8AT57_CHISP|nr:unnamed protein product [Chilo suppressalis]
MAVQSPQQRLQSCGDPMFIMSNQGGVLLCIGGYTFRKHRQRSNKTRWNCSSHKNCKAVVYTSDDTNEIMKCNNVHNHPIRVNKKIFISERIHLNKKSWAFNIAQRASISQKENLYKRRNFYKCYAKYSCKGNVTLNTGVRILPQSLRGRPIVMIEDHTFSFHKKYGLRTRWRCSKSWKGCKASVITVEDIVTKSYLYHDHRDDV